MQGADFTEQRSSARGNATTGAAVPLNVHPLTDLIWLYNEQAPPEARRRKVALLVQLLDSDESIDGERVVATLTADLGLVVPRAVTLIRRANSQLSKRAPVDEAPIVANVRGAKLAEVDKMEQLVAATHHLRRVLTPRWFAGLRSIIAAWDPATLFKLPTHTAFMGHFTDVVCYGGDYLQKLDDAFVQLEPYGSIKQKLREIAGATAGYVSTAFEMLILRAFAATGIIEAYEPPLPAGGRGEARVNLGGQSVYVEARVKMDEPRGGGAFNPRTMGVKLFRKMQEKYVEQYAGIDAPLVIFFSLGASVMHDIEVEAMITEVLQDRASKTLTAVVFSDFYQPHKMWLWRNRRATHRLTPAAVSALYALFPIRRFRTTGLVLPKRSRRAAAAASP